MSVPASSFTPVPPSEYGWTPIPASKSPNAIIKVSRLTTPSFTAPKHCFVEQDDKEEKVIIPVWVFLLEKDGKAYFWDLGMMEKYSTKATPAVLENLKFFLPSSGPGPITQLAQNGYDMDKLEAVFLSHKHMDHCGDLDTLPPRVPIILGPGALESIGPGYPQDPKSEWKSSWLTDHPVASIPGSAMKSDFELEQATYSSGGEGKKDVFGIKGKKWEKIGCWDHAINWFGDGSFWLIDSPGHCAGHLSALVRVTASPDTYILLSGDTCHQQCMYLPIPSPGQPDKRSRIGSWQDQDGSWCSMHEDLPTAVHSMGALTRASQEDNIMVLLAHEKEIEGLAPNWQEGDLADWKEQGWKEAKEKNA